MAVAQECKAARDEPEVIEAYISQLFAGESGDVAKAEPKVCRQFREEAPDEFVRLIGYTLGGAVTLYKLYDDFDVAGGPRPTAPCYGIGGYDDIRGGLDVVLQSEDSYEIVGHGRLWTGMYKGIDSVSTGPCLFPFRITGVPAVDFYYLELGSYGGRGRIVLSLSDLVRQNWVVRLDF